MYYLQNKSIQQKFINFILQSTCFIGYLLECWFGDWVQLKVYLFRPTELHHHMHRSSSSSQTCQQSEQWSHMQPCNIIHVILKHKDRTNIIRNSIHIPPNSMIERAALLPHTLEISAQRQTIMEVFVLFLTHSLQANAMITKLTSYHHWDQPFLRS
jgi:hypothetical protein